MAVDLVTKNQDQQTSLEFFDRGTENFPLDAPKQTAKTP